MKRKDGCELNKFDGEEGRILKVNPKEKREEKRRRYKAEREWKKEGKWAM